MGNKVLAVILLCTSSAFAASTSSAFAASNSTVKLGTEGVYLLRWNGPALEAKPVDDGAPIVLRIASVSPNASPAGDSSIYELRFIGARPGDFDLRDSLCRSDGKPIPAGQLESMPVSIQSVLPNDHDGELEDRAVANIAWPWRYRLILAGLAILWAVPVLGLALRRIFRRRPQRAIILEEKPRTLAEQLLPLVEAAIAGRLTTHEQARLERMLVAFWREQLDLTGLPMDLALARLRGHGPSAELLDHLDHWLHDRPGRHVVDVAAILRPYCGHAPVDIANPRDAVLIDDAFVKDALVKEVTA